MPEGIRDTSAQDVIIEKPRRAGWLKWLLPAAGLIVLGALLVSALSTWLSAEASISSDRIRMATVERGDLVRDLNVQGRVVAAISPTLYSPATGTVTLEVQPGDEVTENQVLAVVDSPEVRSLFLQEQSTLDRLQAELEREKIQARKAQVKSRQVIDLADVKLTAAEREMRRADESIQTNAISEIDYERARDELARARVEHAHAVQDAQLETESLAFEAQTRQLAVDRQRLIVEELRRRVDDLSIRSPVTGIVGNVGVTQKAVVDENAPLVTVVDLSAFEIEIRIPEAYADDLGIGMGAEVQHNFANYRGELVSLSAEVINNEVTGRIRFADEPPPGLRQNQRLTTRILLAEFSDVMMVQRGQFLDSGGGRMAYVINDDRVAQRRQIQTGAYSLGAVEILTGLQPGETIVISNLDPFRGADTVLLTD